MASSSHSKKKTNFYGSKLCTVTGVVSSAVAPNVDILFLFILLKWRALWLLLLTVKKKPIFMEVNYAQ